MPVGFGVDLWVEYGVCTNRTLVVCSCMLLVHGKEACGWVVGVVLTITFRVYTV